MKIFLMGLIAFLSQTTTAQLYPSEEFGFDAYKEVKVKKHKQKLKLTFIVDSIVFPDTNSSVAINSSIDSKIK
ncbi:hypothetical protein ACQ33O_00795 [Ferruginibacter sp. SUN002]|uniref:hypothetical protein n=1 Tax=Ferruginibacter sp. SUN002 TaxID=2937789 RepID=UPI003D367EB5